MSRRVKMGLAAAFAVALMYAVPYVLPSFVVSLISLMFISGLLATSVNMLAGESALVSIGHAGIAAAAGYGVAWGTIEGLGLGPTLILALVLSMVVSAIFGLTTMRTRGIVYLMITLALGMLVYGLAFRLSEVTGGQNGLTGIDRPSLISAWWQYYFFVATVFILATGAVYVLRRSPFGLTLRAIRDSETRAISLGYSVPATKLAATMLSGLLAATAGVLAVWNSEFISPASASFSRSAMAVVIVILGGTGTLFGPLVGASIVVSIEHLLSSYVERWPTILGLAFIAVVLFFPRGLVGSFAHRMRAENPVPSERPRSEDLNASTG